MYLMNFGYLPQSDLETGNLRTETQLKEAIAHLQVFLVGSGLQFCKICDSNGMIVISKNVLQQFAGLKPTGELTAETKRLITKPRCGVADFVYEESRRRKRYTLRGPKWGYTNLTWR
ncbi:hypothetical protein J437_LFUL016987 [Ladona fulva]|uniref:Uncharacterized protein n=1 Tax=Ladona fulva TaxID=123851 RepID=A0A8K0KLT4_LADFU|nr:hypothetical protein J437_LFUL016987 [Ladona fulva]